MKHTVFGWNVRHVKYRFLEVLSIRADVSQQATQVLKHRILNYFYYRSVITILELISLNLTLTGYEHASQSYYRRLLLSILLEHNMVFQYDKMTRGDLPKLPKSDVCLEYVNLSVRVCRSFSNSCKFNKPIR